MLALSRPASQLLANSELPKGLPPKIGVRCGSEPALKRDRSAALLVGGPRILAPADAWGSLCIVEPLPYGDGEGVAWPDLVIPGDVCDPLEIDMAGKREGTVPARVRRIEDDAEAGFGLPPVAWPASKSGKLSLLGDSGIVSRSGVEWPLPEVGGPQICGVSPSCCCISRALSSMISLMVSLLRPSTDDGGQLTAWETGDSPYIPLMESQLQHDQFLPGCQLLPGHCPVDNGGLTLQVPRSASWPATYSQTVFDAY